MQLMSWMVSRLGSRFSLVFEPHRRQVKHSALGRFLDQPMDLMVGLVDPDGVERVLPFTKRGTPLFCCEQFERINSLTFRGYSEHYRLRFEFNVHSVFYPQDEALCTAPAFYLEMRISGCGPMRWVEQKAPTPQQVKLFIRLRRPDTQINTEHVDDRYRIALAYHTSLMPNVVAGPHVRSPAIIDRQVQAHERIVSLNEGCVADEDGQGLMLDLPVTQVGSGIKWRLVWVAHCGDPVLEIGSDHAVRYGRFRYVKRLPDIEAAVRDAVTCRDDRLAHSRRFEKLFDQSPLRMAQRHLVNLGFAAFLGNTFWCDLAGQDGGEPSGSWFGVWEGRDLTHCGVDTQYNTSMFYLALWPQLLAMLLRQLAPHAVDHPESGGVYVVHDLGHGCKVNGQAYDHAMPVEQTCNYLLMLQAHAHWTGDLSVAQQQVDMIEQLVKYLLWSDREDCGFATEGTANAIDDAGPALQFSRRQTYLGVKRVAALRAGGDLLGRIGRGQMSQRCEQTADRDAQRVESQTWLGDHFAVSVDRWTMGLVDPQSGDALPYEQMEGCDAYSIYTANGLLLAAMVGQPWMLDEQRLRLDLTNATRETLGHYGCGHSSHESENVRISQNVWRDHLACYLGMPRPYLTQRYWDLQVMSNTGDQSGGFVDSYVTNNLRYHPRGVTSLGFLLAQVRLVIDRLAPGGQRISIDPDRHVAQRWPLLPLADWKAGKVPVCVVDDQGRVLIESEVDPVIVRGTGSASNELIG